VFIAENGTALLSTHSVCHNYCITRRGASLTIYCSARLCATAAKLRRNSWSLFAVTLHKECSLISVFVSQKRHLRKLSLGSHSALIAARRRRRVIAKKHPSAGGNFIRFSSARAQEVYLTMKINEALLFCEIRARRRKESCSRRWD